MRGTAVSVNPQLVRVVEYNIGTYSHSVLVSPLTGPSVLEPISAVLWSVAKMVLLLVLLLIALKLAWPSIMSLVNIELKQQ